MKIKFSIVTIVLTLLLCGCQATHNPIPKNYQGDRANLADSYHTTGKSSGQFFYLSEVGGKRVYSAISASNQASYGNGMLLTAVGFSRDLPAEPLTLTLVGQVHHAAPVNYMFNAGSNYLVEGDIQFTPKSDENYIVEGYLSDSYSAVWLASSDGKQVSDAIVLEGDPDTQKSKLISLSEGEVVIPENIKPNNEPTHEQASLDNTQSEKYSDNPLTNIDQGTSDKLLVEKLGPPQHIKIIETSIFSKAPETHIYHYKDIGSVEMIKSVADKKLYSKRTFLVTSHEAQQFNTVIANANGVETQLIGKKFFNIGVYDTNNLDALAAKIWENKFTEDRHMLDGIAWYCRIISNSETSRYQGFLALIDNDKNIPSKLRRHCDNARESIDKLKLAEVEQFKPL